MLDSSYFLSILQGTLVTIEIAIASLVIATSFGLIIAFARVSKFKIIQKLSLAYVTIVRGIPELVWLLLIFFGGQILINSLTGILGQSSYIDISPFVAGIFAIGFIYAAYMAETFRGAILAINIGQIEAAQSMALSKLLVIIKIILPQIVRHALPGFTNNWLVLLKATALVSLIGLNDMVGVAEYASAATKSPFFYYFLVALVYLALTSISLKILKILVNRFNIEGHN